MAMTVPAGFCKGCLLNYKRITKVPEGSKWCDSCRPSKHGNRKVPDPDGGRPFDSVREFRRYQDLKVMARTGAIRNLERQVRIPLVVKDVKVATFVADHVYEERDGLDRFVRVVEDVKPKVKKGASPYRTRTYKIKARLFLALFGYPIREV